MPSKTWAASNWNACIMAKAAKAALAMANPLVTALVVFPTASISSVTLRFSSPMPVISTIPPALSAMGPNASMLSTIPAKLSMAMAVRDVPNMPYRTGSAPSGAAAEDIAYEMIMAVTRAIMNGPVDCSPLIIPIRVSEAYPHLAESAISLTGPNL